MRAWHETETIDAETRPQFKALIGGPTRVPTAAEVRAARDRLGLEQDVFAALLGVRLDQVRAWEAGARRVQIVRDRQVFWWVSALTECPFCHRPMPHDDEGSPS